jgi:hypothetical protein
MNILLNIYPKEDVTKTKYMNNLQMYRWQDISQVEFELSLDEECLGRQDE